MATITEQVMDAAIAKLEREPAGLRFQELARRICASEPSLNINTVKTMTSSLHERHSDLVYKPSRGLFRHTKFRDTDQSPRPSPDRRRGRPTDGISAGFAEWLVNELEECTTAIAVIDDRFGPDWSTPGVIGKRESKRSDIIQTPVEIVAAEIANDRRDLASSFGRACSHCLFSHKAYLVVSNITADEDVARLDAVCQIFGIGLVLYDASASDDLDFRIRCRARYQQPDLFFTNKYLAHVESELFA